MNALSARVLASVALAGLCIVSSRTVLAELPQLQPAQQVEPTAAEVAADTDNTIMFGQSVSVDGNTAIVGMPEYGSSAGAVAVFNRSSSGRWSRVATLVAPEPTDSFGSTVFLAGDTALVASDNVVFVFRKIVGAWSATATIHPPAGRPFLNFGFPQSLKYRNGTVTVGAEYSDDFTNALFLYRLNALGQVVSSGPLVSSDPNLSFGISVDLDDDTLVAAGQSAGQGVVAVFQRSGNQWVQTQEIARPVTDPNGGFPGDVALNRDVLLVGDPLVQFESAQSTSDGHSAGGAAYVFTKSHGSYTYRATLRPTPDQLFNYWQFGSRIVTDGDRAVISALEPPSFLYANGVAVEYERHGDAAVATHIARFDDLNAMSISGNRLLLGSPYFVDYDDNSFHLLGWADFYALPSIPGH